MIRRTDLRRINETGSCGSEVVGGLDDGDIMAVFQADAW
jgi:hypothetical protein